MGVPSLTAEGFLPRGRFPCTLEELEDEFVDHERFRDSSSRDEIFGHFLSAVELLNSFDSSLIENVWVGGSFVTDRIDPDDIDCLFVLSGPVYDALPSNNKRNQVKQFNRKGWLRERYGLRVESFLLVRVPFANPWDRGGVHVDAAPYAQVRGAWDDWWLRTRTGETADEEPRIESAEPRRGYMEVTL